jgi:hypothetical protein
MNKAIRIVNWTQKHLGPVILVVALAASVPGLVYTSLVADGLTRTPGWEYALLIARAVCVAVVLTGGNGFMAHIMARHFRARSVLSWVLLLAWLAVVALITAILAPVFMVSLQKSEIVKVMPAVGWQWAYSFAFALALDLAVAGIAAAHALLSKAQRAESERHSVPERTAPPLFPVETVAGSAPSDLSEFAAVVRWDGEPEVVRMNGHSNGHSETRANSKAACPQCGRLVSDTANGWNAHRRFCPGSNGNGAH